MPTCAVIKSLRRSHCSSISKARFYLLNLLHHTTQQETRSSKLRNQCSENLHPYDFLRFPNARRPWGGNSSRDGRRLQSSVPRCGRGVRRGRYSRRARSIGRRSGDYTVSRTSAVRKNSKRQLRTGIRVELLVDVDQDAGVCDARLQHARRIFACGDLPVALYTPGIWTPEGFTVPLPPT